MSVVKMRKMTKLRRKLQISHFDLIFALRYFALILFPISPGYYSLPRENGEDKSFGGKQCVLWSILFENGELGNVI